MSFGSFKEKITRIAREEGVSEKMTLNFTITIDEREDVKIPSKKRNSKIPVGKPIYSYLEEKVLQKESEGHSIKSIAKDLKLPESRVKALQLMGVIRKA